ncbi:cytochrome P450 [Lasiosphaeria miniovina]|uniref:Cytochrome P450 n=1 Tax=Lasiosphaeria miniovina TaxID=1954250 RepID=A0AA40DU73_9PEZI|nr:cytochrome P450 [Lasiosphaeria miniovina]KAK0713557.1 cytochrome P450 [Lasiosphaeria miniovina]
MAFSDSKIPNWAPSSVVAQAVVGILALFILQTLYRVVTNPLSSIPGPFWSRWTNLPVKLRLLSGSKATYVHSLHERYGPVVRLGPREVDVSDVGAVREVHKARSGFLKDPGYYVGGGVRSVFSALDPVFHAQRRRALGPCFAEAQLETLEPTIVERARLTIAKLGDEMATTGCTDILHWWTLFAMDVISEMCFGESFHMLEVGKKNQYAEDIAEMGSLLPLRGAFPWLIWLAGYVPFFPYFKNVGATRQRVVEYGAARAAQYMRLVETNDSAVRKTLFSSLVAKGGGGQRGSPEQQLSQLDITIESQSYITAGTDTTAITLTYLIYAVLRHDAVRARLLGELQSLPDGFTHRDLRALPYLNLVLEETLRLYGASQGALPRVVPPEGAVLAGYAVPPGVVVSTQNYSLHRDGGAYPDAEKFDPSRWESPSPEAKNAFMPFGIGPRNCIGLNLARMELRLCTALFFRAFPDVRLSSKYGMSDADMRPQINFLVMPAGHRCLVELP